MDQEVEVGEGADAGVAVEGFAERRPLERDHRDAAAVERGVKPAELRDSEQVLPLREDPGGPESIRNVPRNGLSAGDGVKERNQPLALGGREEPFPGGGGEREPVEGGPRPTVDPGAGRGQERLRRDRPAPRLRCPPWPRHAGRARGNRRSRSEPARCNGTPEATWPRYAGRPPSWPGGLEGGASPSRSRESSSPARCPPRGDEPRTGRRHRKARSCTSVGRSRRALRPSGADTSRARGTRGRGRGPRSTSAAGRDSG